MFGDDISIEDTMGVIVKYNTNAILTYSLNTYMPWEGYVVKDVYKRQVFSRLF